MIKEEWNMNYMKRIKEIILFTIVCFMITSCNSKTSDTIVNQSVTDKNASSETQASSTDEPQSRDVFAMDTYMTLTAYGDNAENALDKAEAEIERLDNLLSTGDGNSEIYALNQNGTGTISEDTETLLNESEKLYTDTEGVFDITIYPVMDAWGFTTQNYRIPSEEELKGLLENVNASKIQYDKASKKVTLPAGVKIDFGGIAKGYTSSRIMDIYKKCGVTSGMVSLGGNVQLLGAKPDGSFWRVAVQSPDDTNDYLGVLEAEDKAVITSGGYERYFEENGKIYHHIIDPATGYPAENGLKSVTIVSDDGTLADGLSTSLFIMGKDKACDFWKEHSDKFDMILMTDDNELYVSEGIADVFSSDLTTNIVKKLSEK